MDIELARTFLVVAETRNFVRAGEQLFVTQSTVSARIKSLEEQLGRTLFVRNKAGVTLTSAGELFKKHAATLVHVWEHAKSEVSIPEGHSDVIAIGARFGIWDPILLEWLGRMRREYPAIAVQSEIGMSDTLTRRMAEGTLDISVMYSPTSLPALKAEPLFQEELVLVSTQRQTSPALPDDYVHVDWGGDFRRKFGLAFPERQSHGLRINLGVLGLSFIKRHGGSAYFPKRLVERDLAADALFEVPKAPRISFPAFVVWPAEQVTEAVSEAVRVLKEVAENGLPGSWPNGERP
ncbi:LysR family transcriptional regulator [Parvularcula lutaonensis]|uniref:LysR family transcriptional regulator n=1 Tax=Parvularcula lutaonensis TaxID=491923 RepID=A0ABV7MFG4_9PROT|nr:LysR family transcriptional regulator [Parvularcula lutaonensis]GGY52940.1 transcriptional regulator [Parvularcula lutaonensis]